MLSFPGVGSRTLSPKKCIFTVFAFGLTVSLSLIAQTNPACVSNSVIVNVTDIHGSPVRDLSTNNFRVKLDERPLSISSAKYELSPRRVVVVLDVSGSMTTRDNPNKWEVTRDVLQTFLSMTPRQVPVALLGFSDQVVATFGFDNNRAALLSWLDKVGDQKPVHGGRTALYDALLAGINMLGSHREGDSIYVITDGKDNASQSDSQKRLKEELLMNRVRLFVFLFSRQMTEEDRLGNAIADIATETGGFVFGAVSETESFWYSSFEMNNHVRERIRAETALLNVQIGGFYSLELGTLSNSHRSRVAVNVVDNGGKRRKGLVVNYLRILPACTSTLLSHP